jgi:glycine cleavage system H protein
MSIPADLKYSDTHEWVRADADGCLTVGITHHAQDLLGDLVYVENPAIGRKLRKGEACGVVESVKAASDIYAPVSGEVVAANDELQTAPERVNADPYNAWLFRLKPDDNSALSALLDADAYRKLIGSKSH